MVRMVGQVQCTCTCMYSVQNYMYMYMNVFSSWNCFLYIPSLQDNRSPIKPDSMTIKQVFGGGLNMMNPSAAVALIRGGVSGELIRGVAW